MRGLTLSAEAKRQIDSAIDELAVSKNGDAIARLCRMIARTPVPDIVARPSLVVAPTPAPAPLARPAIAAARDAAPVSPMPKPRHRVVNPRAITAYKKKVKQCETHGPDCLGVLDFSHILSKNDEGDDCEKNGLVQCRLHHSIWEASRRGWWRAVGHRLSPEARGKVLAVYPDLSSQEVAYA